MKKLTIEQQELLQQMIQNNDLKEITPYKALEIIKKQIGNIHVFTDEMPPQQTNIELRNSGLFEIIEQELKEHEQLEKLLKNIFDKDSDLCLEDWTHYDGHHSYHIVVGEGEYLDILISKEDYDLLVRYQNGEEES